MIRLHRTSVGLDPRDLRAGRDLVLDVAPEHGLALEVGVAVSDHLTIPDREAVDVAAASSYAAWRARRKDDTAVASWIDLGWILEADLLAECFVPGARLAAAVRGLTEVRMFGFLDEEVALVREAGVSAHAVAAPRTTDQRTPMRRIPSRLFPGRPRGAVVATSYWNLTPVFRTMASVDPGRLVAAGLVVDGLRRRSQLDVAVHGGWIGHPSNAQRRRARQIVTAGVGGLSPAGALDARALALIVKTGPAAVATAERFRAAFAGRVRLLVTPFDSPPVTRAMVAAARDVGRPSLVVQHGFDNQLNDPDKTISDSVAVWCDEDRNALLPRARGTVTVTGNPGAEHLAETSPSIGSGPIVVLVDYPGRLTALLDERVTLQHVSCALGALARLRLRTPIVIRPHPSDTAAARYEALAAQYGDLKVSVDAATPIESLLVQARGCIGSLSTATLQSAALGIPTVHLDVSGISRPWPFDGTIPLARTEDELVVTLEAGRSASVDNARRALGARRGATENVIALIDQLAP